MTSQPPASEEGRTNNEIKRAVRDRYAGIVTQRGGGCCNAASTCEPAASRPDLVVLSRYSPEELASIPPEAVENAFGCGNPLSFAGVRSGDVVLDIGSGAGIDVLLASKIVGPEGKVIGLDFTPEMIVRARENAAKAGVSNVEFRLGDAEQMPLENNSVDWVISNCVINLAPDKRKVFAEVFRALKPGGRVSISDIVTGGLPDGIRDELGLWASCIAGAIEEGEYLEILRQAGLVDVRVLARQHYDEASISSLIEEILPSKEDQDRVRGLIQQNENIVRSFWSAKIVGRKPA